MGFYDGDLLTAGGSLSFGKNLGKNGFLGLGAGFDAIDFYSISPLFLDFRYFFVNKPFTPYIAILGGYAIGYGFDNYGGWYGNPHLGLRYNFAPKAALNIGLGWRYQSVNIRGFVAAFNTLCLRVGAMF
jgi:hypothetical protein